MPRGTPKSQQLPSAPYDLCILRKMRMRKLFCTPAIVCIHRPVVHEATKHVKRFYDFKYDCRIINAVSNFMCALPANYGLSYEREQIPESNGSEMIARIAIMGSLPPQLLLEHAFEGICACLSMAPFDHMLDKYSNDLPRLLLLGEFRIRCIKLRIADAEAFNDYFSHVRTLASVTTRVLEKLSDDVWLQQRRAVSFNLTKIVFDEIQREFERNEEVPSFICCLPMELKFRVLKEVVKANSTTSADILRMRLVNKAWKRETDRLCRMPHLGVTKNTVNVCDWLQDNKYWVPSDMESFNIFASRHMAFRMLPLLFGKDERFARLRIIFRPSCPRQQVIVDFARKNPHIRHSQIIHLDEYDEINLRTVGWRDIYRALEGLMAIGEPHVALPGTVNARQQDDDIIIL